MSIWKTKSSDEIAQEVQAAMERNLYAYQYDDYTISTNKKLQAIQELSAAANELDEAGHTKLAEFLTNLTIKLSNDLSNGKLISEIDNTSSIENNNNNILNVEEENEDDIYSKLEEKKLNDDDLKEIANKYKLNYSEFGINENDFDLDELFEDT